MPFADASRIHANCVRCALKRVAFHNNEINSISLEIVRKRTPNSFRLYFASFDHHGLLGKILPNLAVSARDGLSQTVLLYDDDQHPSISPP